MKQAVVLIHGIWMTGLEMQLLARRIRRCGYEVHQFRYPSLRKAPAENALKLNQFIAELDADIVHLVAHSLGGIVVTHLFDLFPQQPPGKVLMLGTPLTGSATAMALKKYRLDWLFLGKSTAHGLLGDRPKWHEIRILGMIAGDTGFGVGQVLFSQLSKPHDGTVSVAETMTKEVSDHLRVPYSHFGMLFAQPVATAVCNYLKSDDFL